MTDREWVINKWPLREVCEIGVGSRDNTSGIIGRNDVKHVFQRAGEMTQRFPLSDLTDTLGLSFQNWHGSSQSSVTPFPE